MLQIQLSRYQSICRPAAYSNDRFDKVDRSETQNKSNKSYNADLKAY